MGWALYKHTITHSHTHIHIVDGSTYVHIDQRRSLCALFMVRTWIMDLEYCVCMGNKCPMNHVGVRRYERGGGRGSIWIAKTTILTFTDHNNLNLNLNLPFRKWDHFGRGYAMPQGINLDMCRLCPRDCYFTSKHFKWQSERERQTMTKRGREDREGRNCVRSRFPHSCPRCVALIKTPVIFVQMEMKMKININMGAGECH